MDLSYIFPTINEFSDTWEKAGLLANQLRSQGIIIGLADCYLATLAQQNNIKIFSYDNHFRMIRGFIKIDIIE